ncbi:type II toxin-antitoxin system RelE/ParE family toxin [Rhizobium sp. RU36D]|uniref:type II toxin-antitoxin system RelE/ParE family toxin n=1 Tax=Rhizobium sp. RU36D TaxID=1907415 RepID=UPI0009D907DF|nr:type II toxin-antitoxin system RelE/ParE family toxin [Rhizobium sp. RU36D]SMC99744.1 toxin ParE1/3/4 [Rhizobium sp. RU36D]
MAFRVVYHPQAEAELDTLYADIALSAGARVAGDFVDGLISYIESLETFPERGTVRESRITGLRIIGYRRSVSIAFAVRDEDVLILGVFARGRNITEATLSERDG